MDANFEMTREQKLCQNCWRIEARHLDGRCILFMDGDEAATSDSLTFTPEGTVVTNPLEDWVETPREDDHIRPASFGTKTSIADQLREAAEVRAQHTDPDHYTEGRTFETWDVIVDWELDFCLGNVVKYVSRAGRKGGDNSRLSDLIKAKNYIERAIAEEG